MNKSKSYHFYALVILMITLLILSFSTCKKTALVAEGLTGITIAQNQVTISWAARKDDNYSHTKLSCSNGTSVNIYDAHTGVISGLDSNTEYTFTLNTVDNAGNLYDEITFAISTSTGSIVDVILIETPDQLDSVRHNLSAHYFLKADIDLSEYRTDSGWEPIGNTTNRFTGIFYGNGHIISNLYIKNADDFQALFGRINGGKIKDLGLIDVDITANNHSGGVVGHNYSGEITNCYITGSVRGDGDYTGGLAGDNFYGTITNCYAAVSVKGDGNYTGGLMGRNLFSVVTACYTTGTVSGYGSNNGCLVGYHSGTMADSYATGSISGSNDTGGLVGENRGAITNCYATGTVSGSDYAGGLMGRNHYGVVTDSYATGSVNGNDYTGGFTGYNEGGTIAGCYATGSASGNNFTGGFTGHNRAKITDCYATGSVIGDNYTGGFTGYNRNNITNCYAAVSVKGDGNYTGGLVGYNKRGSIIDCFYNVNTAGQSDIGKGIPKTTTEMKKQVTFTIWNFTEVWGIDNSINNGYPYLLNNQHRN